MRVPAGNLPRVVFIGGSGRSGSTLIERLLGELPAVCNVGEVVQLWQNGLISGEPCGCGVPLPSCPFWRDVAQVAFGGWERFDVSAHLAAKNAVDRTRFIPRLAALPAGSRLPVAAANKIGARASQYAEVYAALYAAISEVSGCPVVIDSSKNASLAFCLRVSPLIDLRLLHVVRDSRAVAYSWTKQTARPEAAAGGKEFMEVVAPARSAMRWNMLHGGLGLLAARGVPSLLSRYEDFTASPEAAMRALAVFASGRQDAGEAVPSFLTGRRAHLGVTHTAAGNPMRFRAGCIEIRRDDAWRRLLPPGDWAAVTALTLPLLARYGYLPGGRAA